jgi:hypothetical protein
MAIRNAEEITTNVAPNQAKDRFRKPLVLGRAANVLSAVPGDEQACRSTVFRDHRGVDRHESAVRGECRFRPAEQSQCALIIEMVDHSERQDKVKPPQVLIETRRVAHAELGPCAEGVSGSRDVAFAHVDPYVGDVPEMVDELSWATSQVEYTCARLRPNIVPDKQAPPSRAADKSRPRLVGVRRSQDTSDRCHAPDGSDLAVARLPLGVWLT